ERAATGAGVGRVLRRLGPNTVCSGGHCPNISECFGCGTATFLIMGATCTRGCRFCAIEGGRPGPLRTDEPEAVAQAAGELGLRHVVITSVTRDDLPDGGAGHFARTVDAVRCRMPEATIEVLTPDFAGDTATIDTVIASGPHIFNHNVETVPRLYAEVRPEADYRRSIDLLGYVKTESQKRGHEIYTKSGLMVGLGETRDEIHRVFADLCGAACDILTVGQYLAPSDAHVPVCRFVTPEEFEALERTAKSMGFAAVASGPFVRSSYNAGALLESAGRSKPIQSAGAES
ncbi:MAG: lipoyl synthase, partial [Planctomycetia bacterium]|nr:lipoyl synthase [Planctomycetia bacterium]